MMEAQPFSFDDRDQMLLKRNGCTRQASWLTRLNFPLTYSAHWS
jgi:hypothetical protein